MVSRPIDLRHPCGLAVMSHSFDDCVKDFSTKSMQSKEEGCVFRCIDIRRKAGERMQQRFVEHNQALSQQNGLGK